MEKRELYDKFEELSQNLMSMLAEVEAIKAIYDDGFHICPDFYGQRRDNNEACGFCAELLYGD